MYGSVTLFLFKGHLGSLATVLYKSHLNRCHLLPSSTDVPVLLLNQPIVHFGEHNF